MERTQIYLTKVQKEKLKNLAKLNNMTMAECIREAINEYVAKDRMDKDIIIEKTFGLWKDRDDIGTDYIENIRSSWNKRLEISE